MNLPLKCHDLIDKVAYNLITKLCAKGKCENCPEIDLEPLADCDSITYYGWRRCEKYYEKELTQKEGIVIAAEMMDNIKDIKMHYFCKRTQNNKYKKQIDESKDGEAIIHVEYSENYKNKKQNEIKFAYYGQGQFSLFTVCIYLKENDKVTCKSYALMTLENNIETNKNTITKIKNRNTITAIRWSMWNNLFCT